MKLHSAGLAALSLAIALGLSACGGDKQAAQQPAADGAAAPAAAGAKVTAEVSGAGASFIFPLVSKWSADYNATTGAKINYQSIGSGGGIAQIKAGTVDFGSSDKPLSSEELAQAGLAQFPSAIGGVVPVVNIEGLEAGKLRLSGALLADIFLGKVKTWNDPAIVAANPGVKLPDGKITLVHRSDGSGTTFNFSNYLSKVSPEWKSSVGEGTSVLVVARPGMPRASIGSTATSLDRCPAAIRPSPMTRWCRGQSTPASTRASGETASPSPVTRITAIVLLPRTPA